MTVHHGSPREEAAKVVSLARSQQVEIVNSPNQVQDPKSADRGSHPRIQEMEPQPAERRQPGETFPGWVPRRPSEKDTDDEAVAHEENPLDPVIGGIGGNAGGRCRMGGGNRFHLPRF